MLFLDEPAVRELLRWEELIPAMERALAEFSRGSVLNPVRAVLTIEEGRRYVGLMPAVASDVMGLKFVAFYPSNAGTEQPTHQATIVLYRCHPERSRRTRVLRTLSERSEPKWSVRATCSF